MKKRILITCLALPILAGCIQPVVMDPMEENLPVVVNCVLRVPSGSVPAKQALTLTYVKGKSQKEFIPVEDAVVYLEQDPMGGRFFFVRKDGCTWETEKKISLCHDTKYTLRVEIPGREPIWAETRIPPYVGLYNMEDNGFCKSFKLKYWPQQIDDPVPPAAVKAIEKCSLWMSASEKSGLDESTALDYLVTDHPGADEFNITGLRFSDLSFRGIPDNEYGLWYQNEFNMVKEHIPDYRLYDKYLRIGDLDFDRSFFVYAGPLFQPYARFDLSPASFASISYYLMTDDLDKYLRSAYIYDKSLSTDLTYLYSMSNDIYSNIHGGLGIFGSCTCSSASFIRHTLGWD